METRIKNFLENASDSRTIEVVEMLLEEGATWKWSSEHDEVGLWSQGMFVMHISFEDDDFSTAPSFDNLYYKMW